jgi:hypothetical protein
VYAIWQCTLLIFSSQKLCFKENNIGRKLRNSAGKIELLVLFVSLKKQMRYQKTQKFFADFRTVEKVAKNAHTKSYKETNLINMSKSGIVHFSITFLSRSFCASIFLQLFQ